MLDDPHNREADWYKPTDELMAENAARETAERREAHLNEQGTHQIIDASAAATAEKVAAALAPVLAQAVKDAVRESAEATRKVFESKIAEHTPKTK